jgi:hemolysin-activating ACP:hemolysin acyltransferase
VRQLHVFVGNDGKLLGYITWAWFSEESEARWQSGTLTLPHISEWNEGDRLWILDFVAMPGQGRLCAWLASSLFPEGTMARALPRRTTMPPASLIQWTSRDHGKRFARWQRIRPGDAVTH